MAIGTVHLESLQNAHVRQTQLELIFEFMKPYRNAILMGCLFFFFFVFFVFFFVFFLFFLFFFCYCFFLVFLSFFSFFPF